MARNFDDDAPRRIRDADDLISARERDADERIYVVNNNLVIDAREKLARRRRLDRVWRAGWAVSWLSLLTAVIGTGIAALTTGDPARFVLGHLVCGSLLLMSLLALVGVHFAGRDLPTLQRAEAQLVFAQEALWEQNALARPDLDDRRHLYREDVTSSCPSGRHPTHPRTRRASMPQTGRALCPPRLRTRHLPRPGPRPPHHPVTAAAWVLTGGWWSAPSPGCTASDDFASAENAEPTCTKPSSNCPAA